MNEKKKMYIIVGTVAVLAVVVLFILISSTISSQKILKEIDEKMEQDTPQIFYLARPTCHYCVLLEPITDQLKEEYNLKYYEINVDKLTTTQLAKILKKFDTSIDTFGTPYIVITRNGKVIGEQSGYSDENILFDLFQKNGLIDEKEKLALNYIDYNTFQTIWNSTEKSIIMIGQTGQASIEARKNIQSIVKENNLLVSYMDIAQTEDNETYDKFLETIGHTDVANPLLMIIQNGKILSETNEITKEAYIKFLQSTGYIS